jgi:sec-independent protein translocase protein TatB
MFGMGFTEIILILVVAVLFLGPDKLPSAIIEIAKFIKGIKKGINEAKSALDAEIQVDELKQEALKYKADMDKMANSLNGFKNIDLGLDEVMEYEKGIESKKENIKLEKDSKKSEIEKDKEVK